MTRQSKWYQQVEQLVQLLYLFVHPDGVVDNTEHFRREGSSRCPPRLWTRKSDGPYNCKQCRNWEDITNCSLARDIHLLPMCFFGQQFHFAQRQKINNLHISNQRWSPLSQKQRKSRLDARCHCNRDCSTDLDAYAKEPHNYRTSNDWANWKSWLATQYQLHRQEG